MPETTGWNSMLIYFFPLPCRRGRWCLGEWTLLRMSHSAFQSCSQPVGEVLNEPEFCTHWEVVCEALRER